MTYSRPTFFIEHLTPENIHLINDHALFARNNIIANIKVDARYQTDDTGTTNFVTETSASAYATSFKKAYATIKASLLAGGNTVKGGYGLSLWQLGNGIPVGGDAISPEIRSSEGYFPLCHSIFINHADKPVDRTAPPALSYDPYPRCWYGIQQNKTVMSAFVAAIKAYVDSADLPYPKRIELNHESGPGYDIAAFCRYDGTGHVLGGSTGWLDDYMKTFDWTCREPIGALVTGKVTQKAFWDAMRTPAGAAIPALDRDPSHVATFGIGGHPINTQVWQASHSLAMAGHHRASYLAYRQPLKAILPLTRLAEYSAFTNGPGSGAFRIRPNRDDGISGLVTSRQGYFQPYDYQCLDMYHMSIECEYLGPDGGRGFGTGTGWGTDENWCTQLGVSSGASRLQQRLAIVQNRALMASMKAAAPKKLVSPYMATPYYSSNIFNHDEHVELISDGITDGTLDSVTWFVPYSTNDSDYRAQFDYIESVMASLESGIALVG